MAYYCIECNETRMIYIHQSETVCWECNRILLCKECYAKLPEPFVHSMFSKTELFMMKHNKEFHSSVDIV